MKNPLKAFTLKEQFLIICWALYDLANQFFALNIVSIYFPRWLTLEKGAPEMAYSLTFGFSMALIAICAPIVGTISDKQGKKKIYLIVCTLISVTFTIGLGLSGKIGLALGFFVLANFGCQLALVFYNALMVRVVKPGYYGFVSGLGGVFGYGGALLALYLTKPVVEEWGYEPTFMLTGVLFLIFALPVMIWIKEPAPLDKRSFRSFLHPKEMFGIISTSRKAFFKGGEYPQVRLFLRAYFFALCAVQTMILFIGVYAGKVFGLSETDFVDLMIFSTFFAVAGSFIASVVSDAVGKKKAMIGILMLWTIGLLGAIFLSPPFHWALGAVIGFALASTWVVTRAWAVEAVPQKNIGTIFGLFTLAGYAAGIVGPVVWSAVNWMLTPLGEWGYRLSLVTLLVFIALAFIDLIRIPDRKVP
jgi:MFS transporter, UMF1 family